MEALTYMSLLKLSKIISGLIKNNFKITYNGWLFHLSGEINWGKTLVYLMWLVIKQKTVRHDVGLFRVAGGTVSYEDNIWSLLVMTLTPIFEPFNLGRLMTTTNQWFGFT